MKIKLFLLCIACCCQVGYAKQNQEKDPERYTLFPYYNNTTKLWGYADSSGKVLIAPKFIEVRHFFYGFAKVKSKEGWSLIDQKGAKSDRYFYDSIAYVPDLVSINCWLKDRIYTLRIVEGKLLRPGKNEVKMSEEYSVEGSYPEVIPPFDGAIRKKPPIVKLFKPEHSDQWYLGRFDYNTETNAYEKVWQSMEHFDEVGEARERSHLDFALIKQKGKYGLIGWDGNARYFIHPSQYDTILFPNFYNSVFFGMRNGKYAIIQASKNRDTQQLLYFYTEPRFDDIKTFAVSNIPVKENNNWYIVYAFGTYTVGKDTLIKNPELSFIDDHVEEIKDGGISHESFFYYRKNGLWGFARIDYSSKIIKTEAAYASAKVVTNWFNEYEYYYWNKMLLYVTMPDGKQGYVTMKGVKLFE